MAVSPAAWQGSEGTFRISQTWRNPPVWKSAVSSQHPLLCWGSLREPLHSLHVHVALPGQGLRLRNELSKGYTSWWRFATKATHGVNGCFWALWKFRTVGGAQVLAMCRVRHPSRALLQFGAFWGNGATAAAALPRFVPRPGVPPRIQGGGGRLLPPPPSSESSCWADLRPALGDAAERVSISLSICASTPGRVSCCLGAGALAAEGEARFACEAPPSPRHKPKLSCMG